MGEIKISPLMLGGLAVGAYLLLKPSVPVTTVPGTVPVTPGNALTSLLPGLTPTQAIPTTYGINSGVKGGNGSFYTCANYAQLLAAHPNLGNPNYQMSAAENQQYLSNYQDLQTGLPSWIGHKQLNGVTPNSIQQAAQTHWTTYGCAEKRIFLPLTPPSTASYIPPPVNTQSSGGGGSWVGTALQVAGSVAIALIGPGDPSPGKLSDAEVNIMVTGSAIIKNILPFYLEVAPELVASINNKVNGILSEYQP